MKFKTLYLAAVMLLAALQVVHADTYSNVYTLADVTQGNEGEVVDPSLNKEWEPGIDWHTMQIGSGGLYISNNKGATYITLASNRTQFADADLWYRTGNNTDGYLIYNKEAGPNKVLAAPTTMKGTQGGDSYPIMVDKDHVPEGYTSTWLFAKSNDLGSNVEAFYMYEKGHEGYKVNNRNGKFAFWTGGADHGSSIQWKWAQRTMEVNMNTGTFTSKNSNWAKTWTSTASAPKLVVDAGANNMSIANSNATRIQAFRGTTEPQSYTISAGADYAIAAYSFDFVMSGTTAITLTDAAGHKYTSKSTAQTVDCKDLNERSTSFQLSGANAGVDLTHFLVTIRKAAVPAEPQVEIFTTPTTQAIPYRIPAIATAYDGTVVAVADYRYSRVDIGSGRIDLHIRRSHDNGATWSEPQYIDEEFIYSKFDKSAYGPIRGWFVGSGKICQSKTTKVGTHYRLYCVGSSCRQGSNETANWVLYSDDFGKTWLFLGGCDESPVPGGDEPKAEELPDGSILLSSRCTGGRNFNIFTFSDTRSGQGTWGQVAFSGSGNKGVTALSNACNGEVLLVPVTRKKDKKTMFLLLQSLPFGSGRANVGIYYKALESLADYRTPDAIAKDWDGRHQSSYISSAYSTMTWQKNNTIGFVYEEDTYGTSGGGYTIIYKNYSIEQITDSAFTYNPSVNGDSLTALGMGAVVDDVTSTDNVGTIVGQYTPEAAHLVNDAYSEYAAHPSRQQYERLNGIIGSAPRVKMGLERYYTLRNYGRGAKRYALYANNATELSVSTNRKAGKAMWCIVPTADDPEVFYLVNKAHPKSMVGPTLAVETRTVLTSNPKEAGRYRIVSTTQGLSKLQCLNPTNATYPFLHLAGDNVRIVPWLASSPANNAPSFWYIEPTDVMTGIEHITLPPNPNAAAAAKACYDLGGRAIQQPQKGQVYIKGGKKRVE